MVVASRSSLAEIFAHLRAHPRTTRTEITGHLGLSKATVSEAISTLMVHGLVREVGKQQHGRGRSQVILEFQAQTRLVIGVHFSEDGCHAVLTDLLANPIDSTILPLAGTTPEDFVEAVSSCVDVLSRNAAAPIIGLGVGVPGLVDPNGREIIASVPYGWSHVPIADILEPRLNLPTVVANRAKAAALGEYWHGDHAFASDRRFLAYIHAGAGIASGLVIDGELYYGKGGSAGEIGHITVDPNGLPCGCGNRGCLHTVASESAIVRSVRISARLTPVPGSGDPLPSLGAIGLPGLIERASAGDELVLAAIDEAGSWLGIATSTLLNLMNPSVVVIGGSVAAFGDPLFDAVRTEVRQRALWDALDGVSIVPSVLGDDAGTIGAAALFLSQLDVASLLDHLTG